MKSLSVIIPHYNIPELLCRLLSTIPDQEDIEIIVVDDCSTEPINMVDQYISERRNISLYRLDHNLGAGYCRNIGLEKASGKWVVFADADDFFLSKFYENVYPYFSCDADVVFFTAVSEEIETGNIGTRHILLNKTICDWNDNQEDKKAELNIRYKINGPVCKLISLDMVRKNHIMFDSVKVSNDEMFSTGVGFYAKKLLACTNPIYCITSRPGSLIEVISKENFMIRLKVFIRKYNFLKEHLSEEDFKILDLSAQEKIFSMVQNRYDFLYCLSVIRELIKGKVRFFTTETFKPRVLLSKLKLAYILSRSRKREKKYIMR